jgi:hypothetical protein
LLCGDAGKVRNLLLFNFDIAIPQVRPGTQFEYLGTQLRDVRTAPQKLVRGSFFVHTLTIHTGLANATLTAGGHNPHQQRERRQHEGAQSEQT